MSLGYYEFLSSVALATAYASYEEGIRKAAESGFSQFAAWYQYSRINCLSKKKVISLPYQSTTFICFLLFLYFLYTNSVRCLFFSPHFLSSIQLNPMSGGEKKKLSWIIALGCVVRKYKQRSNTECIYSANLHLCFRNTRH